MGLSKQRAGALVWSGLWHFFPKGIHCGIAYPIETSSDHAVETALWGRAGQ